MARIRAAVVGGGIIGTAVARRLAQHLDGAEVTLFEKEDRLAAHQTGHNSGVVHAGLYYEPGSLKARLCRRGVTLLQEFTTKHGIAYDECGKVVVALDESEFGRLDAIHERSIANGVPGVRMLDADQLREIEPHAAGVRALHSPHTAIIDFPSVTKALAEELHEAGGKIRLGFQVDHIKDRGAAVRVGVGPSTDEFDLVIVCAGLQSDRVAQLSGESREPRIVPFYGDYYLLDDSKTHLVNGLIYPVPDPRFPFLGVHVTRRIDGAVMLGPNAYLSLGREAYRPGQVMARDLREALGFSGLWRFAAGNLPAAIRESRTAMSSGAFVAEARKYLPAIEPKDVRRGPRGIRAQAMDAKGRLVDDFVITGTKRLSHVRNAPSPGATSAMAIAEYVVAEALERADLGTASGQAPPAVHD